VLRLAPLIIFAASAALAFTPTHVVIVDSTPLYEKEHPFDEEHVLTTLDYWTAVAVASPEPVWTPDTPPRQVHYLVTIEDGTEGLVPALDIGSAWVVVEENTPIYETGCPTEPIGPLKKGELVTERNVRFPSINYLLPIRTKQKLDGWVEYDTVERAYVWPTPRTVDYGGPREGPPQQAGK